MTDLAPVESRVGRLLNSDPELMQDSYSVLNDLREHLPVHRLGDYVLVSGYADICRILGDGVSFSNRSMEEGTARVINARATLTPSQCPKYEEFLDMERAMTFMADGEEHARRRKTTAHLFSPGRTKKMGELTQQYTDELLDSVGNHEVVDANPVTGLLPGWIIANLLGLPRTDSSRLVEWGDAINLNLHRSTHIDEAHEALRSICDYIDESVLKHGDDVPARTELLEAILGAADQNRLSSMFVELQVGGYETTRGLLSGGILALMESRDQWELLVADPTLAKNATEELLRLVSPARWTARVSTVDTLIGDVRIAPGDTLLLILAAGNRDPEMFPDPDRLDITRSNAKLHRAFGVGPHYCIGQSLARLEGEIFFRTLATRFPSLSLDGDSPRRVGNANNPQLDCLRIRPGGPRG